MKKRAHRDGRSAPSVIIIGSSSFLISLLLFASVLALIAYTGSNPTALCGAFSIAALILASAVMGVAVAVVARDRALSLCALCSLTVIGLMLIAELCVNRFRISAPFIINCACAVGVAMIATKLVKSKGRRKMRIRRI